jgi:hypothetical protein
MDRRTFLRDALGTTGMMGVGYLGGQRSFESATISVQLVEEIHGTTSALLTEHGEADYCIVEAFYWTKVNGVRLLLHDEKTTPLPRGAATAVDIPMAMADIAFLRVKELKLLNQSEFGDKPK